MTNDDNLAERMSALRVGRDGEAWLPSAAGLGLYISALRARLLVAVLGYCVGLFAVALKSPKLGDALLVATPALSFAICVVMAAAVLRYARLPKRTAGKGMARVSFALLVGSALFSAYALLLALFAAGVTVVPASLNAEAKGAFTAVWRLPWADLASQIALLASLFALLMSFAGVAGSINAEDVRRRASRALNVVSLATCLAWAARASRSRRSWRPRSSRSRAGRGRDGLRGRPLPPRFRDEDRHEPPKRGAHRDACVAKRVETGV
jgi:hypothetical protein